MFTIHWLRQAWFLLITIFTVYIIIREANLYKQNDGNECMKSLQCPEGEKAIVLRPESRTKPPLICLNNERLFDASKLVKGLNIAVLDGRRNVVSAVHYLSVQDSDFSVVRLLAQVQRYEIIIGTSYGDVASKISAEARQLLHLFGFSLAQYKTENSILFMGQLGLSAGEAFERVTSLRVVQPEYYIRCFTSPMGKLSNVTIRIPEAHHIDENTVAQLAALEGRKMPVKLGMELPNCGHPKSCQEDEIPMSFYSGKDKDDTPQLCVNGRFVIDRGLNSAGRGLNLVVIDSKTHQVMRTGHYDTYLEDSSALVLFLEQLSPGEIVAVISFDEASNNLSDMAKRIFYDLGSSLIYYLKFRASWYFIGQMGIDGYSPFEDMNLPSGNDWAKPISLTLCVPSVLNGPIADGTRLLKAQNMLRRHFCSRYDGYEDFCDENRLDIPVVPRGGQTTHLQSTDPIYSVPILVAGGLNMNNIRLCLESIYKQDGINPQNVVVAFDLIYNEIFDLTALFLVRSLPIKDTIPYEEFVLKSIDQMMTLFPSAPYLIVIEEDTILLPGFLHFLGQLLPHFMKDDTVSVIQTFNQNGGESHEVDASVYRVENGAAAGAFMLKKSFYEEFIKNRRECCRRTTFGWQFHGISYLSVVSRVMISKTLDLNTLTEEWNTSKESSRNTELLNGDEVIINADQLDEESYDADLRETIVNGMNFFVKDNVDCQEGAFIMPNENHTSTVPAIVIIYNENTNVLLKLARCFNLKLIMNRPLGLYKGTVRFTTKHASYVLVASSSPFLKPKSQNFNSTALLL